MICLHILPPVPVAKSSASSPPTATPVISPPPAPVPVSSPPAPVPVSSPPAPTPTISPPAVTPSAEVPAPAPIKSKKKGKKHHAPAPSPSPSLLSSPAPPVGAPGPSMDASSPGSASADDVQVYNPDQEVLASTSKKKPPVSSFKLLKANGTSKFTSTPVKSTAPISSLRDNIATPMNNKPAALSMADKKITTPKSLQMSVNFTPIRELNRLTASVMRKFESTRVGAGSSKASKDSLTSKNPNYRFQGEAKASFIDPTKRLEKAVGKALFKPHGGSHLNVKTQS